MALKRDCRMFYRTLVELAKEKPKTFRPLRRAALGKGSGLLAFRLVVRQWEALHQPGLAIHELVAPGPLRLLCLRLAPSYLHEISEGTGQAARRVRHDAVARREMNLKKGRAYVEARSSEAD